jgi:hypothetical protein
MTCVTTLYGITPETVNATLVLPPDRPPQAGLDNPPRASNLSIALDLQSKVFLSLGAEAAALFGVGLLLLLLKTYFDKKDIGSEPGLGGRFLHRAPSVFLFLSTALAFASALAITQTGNALEFATTGTGTELSILSGKTLQALQWLAFGFSVLFSFVLAIWSKRKNDTTDEGAERGSASSAPKPNLLGLARPNAFAPRHAVAQGPTPLVGPPPRGPPT